MRELRPHQETAVAEVVGAFRNGNDLVVLDAPTGSGKTLIAEVVRQILLPQHTSYVCSSLTLQDQFSEDFPYAREVRGRDNYPTVYREDLTAGDCTGETCGYCPSRETCPYIEARDNAAASSLAVVNATYQLYAGNYSRPFMHRDFMVIDECDTMEGELRRFAECFVSRRQAEMVGMVVPKKGAHYSTVGRWLSEWANRAGEHARTKMKGNNPASSRKRRAMQQRAQLAAMVAGEMARDENLWVRQPHAAALIMKPVTVGQMADRLLWARANKFLLMSGTVVSAELMLDDLGWEGPWTEVKVPMTFPAENRRIIARGRIDMTAKNKDVAWPQMVEAVNEVLADHPDENVLVHTVSYKLAEYLHRNVRCSHRMLTYLDSAARENVLMEFKDEGRPKVLFASSMDRGVDLPDDLCRVQVVAKVPYPSLGDRQVSARMRLPGGQMWYSVETVRRLVQMTGRGVRSEDDWCLTYILDGQFKSNVLGRNRRFLPDWWKQAVERQ